MNHWNAGPLFRPLEDFLRVSPQRVQAASESAATRLSAIYGDRLKVTGMSTEAQRHLIELERFPDEFHGQLLRYVSGRPQGGIYVIDGPVTDVLPELRGVRPRGWPKGTTWADVPGGHHPSSHQLIMGGQRRHASVSLAGHEGGHGLDRALGGASATREFREVYDQLGLKMPYFTQPGNAGPSETFAEGIAAWTKTRGLPLEYRTSAIGDALGLPKSAYSRCEPLDRYFFDLKDRL